MRCYLRPATLCFLSERFFTYKRKEVVIMGPQPWSAFPAALHVYNSDTFASVQAGVNLKLTRPLFLTAVAGEEIGFDTTSGATMRIEASGEITLRSLNTQDVQISSQNATLHLFDDGTVNIGSVGVHTIYINNFAGPQIIFLGSLLHFSLGVGASMIIDYHPAHPGDWVGGVTDLVSAMDRIARVVSNLGITPIP
jgi:hypothetical protein